MAANFSLCRCNSNRVYIPQIIKTDLTYYRSNLIARARKTIGITIPNRSYWGGHIITLLLWDFAKLKSNTGIKSIMNKTVYTPSTYFLLYMKSTCTRFLVVKCFPKDPQKYMSDICDMTLFPELEVSEF